ncbi:MAG: TldD/PmbA family protein, partial [Clostridia bacterium]|nr:TldD/PmbA family protein [Clostridia bacterium]
MIDKRLAEEILGIALSGGGDFAEIYQELTKNGNVRLLDGKIEAIGDNVLSGVGIRTFIGTQTVYATTTDITREGLIRCARSVAEAVGEIKSAVSVRLCERIFPNIHPVTQVPATADMKYKLDLLKSACTTAKNYHESIVQVGGTLLTVDHSILVANSEGLYTTDRHIRTRMAVNAVASNGKENQSGSCAPGRG